MHSASSDPFGLFEESELTPIEEIEEEAEVSDTEGPPLREREAEKQAVPDGEFEAASQPAQTEGAPKGGAKKRLATTGKVGRKKPRVEGGVQETAVKAPRKRTQGQAAPNVQRRTWAMARLQSEETKATVAEAPDFNQQPLKAAGGEVKCDDDLTLPGGVSVEEYLAGTATATSQPKAGQTEGSTSPDPADHQGAEQEGKTKAGGSRDRGDRIQTAVALSDDSNSPKPTRDQGEMEHDDISMDMDAGRSTIDVQVDENSGPGNQCELTAQSQVLENHGASKPATNVTATHECITNQMPRSRNDPEDVGLSRLDAEDSDDESKDEGKQTGIRKGKRKGEAKPLKNGGDRRYFRDELLENEAIEAIEQFCPEAATTCRELAIQVLVSQQAFIKCNYHHKSGKHRRRYIFDDMNPDDPSPRVTGVPFAPSEPKKNEDDQSFRKEKDTWAPLVRFEMPKRNGIEVCHCGCTLEDALWGLYLWKTSEIASASSSGRWDNYRTDWIDPRQRKLIIERLREHGVRLEHLWKYRLEAKGPVRVYVEVSKADHLRAQITVLMEMLAELEGEEDSETSEAVRSKSAK
ncbi:hypothetical protein AAF712_010290 [Marasmius tenuissimus]|uniref:Uncharacterized protein n=1 Tax=Marasmius tenuissimus TaxID=585030 RepID=A0ABR2ZME2_9AGAR